MKKPRYVLDSYALMAYLQNEAAAGQVDGLLVLAARSNASLHMSLINLGEIAYLVKRRYGPIQCERVLDKLKAFPIAL